MIGQLANIPIELRQLKQWCLWKFEDVGAAKPTKIPYQPNGYKANVQNSNTFNTFDACASILGAGHYDGLGFIFTDTEFSGIDLDDASKLANGDPNPNYQSDLARQIKIAHEFDSYSEVSPSGKGLHIIVKGKVPDGKHPRNYIELYPSGRYFTMTGQVHNAKPIGEYQDLLTQLWVQMGGVINGHAHAIADQPETISDQEIIALALKHNTITFAPLLDGHWHGAYPSQSEADQAFANILAYYTNSKAQVDRIFRNSKLMRSKVNDNKGYLPRTIRTAFDQKVPPIDFEGMKNALEEKLAKDQLALDLGAVAQRLEPFAHNGLVASSNLASPTTAVSSNGKTEDFDSSNLGSIPNTASNLDLPPGLLGEIAQFIYQAAPRQVKEVALAAAIGLMAGICGRAYNVSSTGLNQYVLLLAMTGTGKEAAASGISKLMNTIKMQVPTSTSYIGPSEISSGAALFKYFSHTSQSFVSLLGEFGLRLQQLSNPNANGSEVSLRRMFLDLYNKSGFNDVLAASIYSKKEDSSTAVLSPAFSILGESTPERFYGALNEDMISEGFLPRFLLIEYKGDRPVSNKQHSSVIPNWLMVERLAALVAQCETVSHSNPRRVINVQYDDDAYKLLDDYDVHADNKVKGAKEVIRQLWNRAHIKALKLAALIAVGENMIDPTINIIHAKWAIDMVNSDINTLTQRFEEGDIGSNSFELKQRKEALRILKDYLEKDASQIQKYKGVAAQHKDKVVNNSYLNNRLAKLAVFNNDKLGGTRAMKRVIDSLSDSGHIVELKGQDLAKYKTVGKLYFIYSYD